MCRITGRGLGCWEKEASTTAAVGGSSKFTLSMECAIGGRRARAGSGYVLVPCAPQSAVCRSSEIHHGGHTCAVPQTRRFELHFSHHSQRMMAPGMAWCLAGSEMEACTAKHADRDARRTSAGGACQARKRLLIRTSAVREWSGPGGCRAGVDGLPQLLTVQYWTSGL